MIGTKWDPGFCQSDMVRSWCQTHVGLWAKLGFLTRKQRAWGLVDWSPLCYKFDGQLVRFQRPDIISHDSWPNPPLYTLYSNFSCENQLELQYHDRTLIFCIMIINSHIWLVVSTVVYFSIGNFIIPTDELIFFQRDRYTRNSYKSPFITIKIIKITISHYKTTIKSLSNHYQITINQPVLVYRRVLPIILVVLL